jgi:hypothetical protein
MPGLKSHPNETRPTMVVAKCSSIAVTKLTSRERALQAGGTKAECALKGDRIIEPTEWIRFLAVSAIGVRVDHLHRLPFLPESAHQSAGVGTG